MTLTESWNKKAWPRILAAFLINAVFLALMLTFFEPRFETNDDVLMSKFVDGQFSVKTAYVPFINISLGWLLKTLYTIGGDSFNWYSAVQYLTLYLGFTAITWTFLRRFRLIPALAMTAIALFSLGMDCYLGMNFSKPSGVATVGAMALILTGLRNDSGRVLRPALILGVLLGLMGFVWRYEEFGVCAVLMAGACIPYLLELWRENRGLKKKLGSALSFFAPFMLLAVLAVGLLGVNIVAWKQPDIAFYTSFDATRSLLIDFEIPDYEDMPEVYDELDMDENFVYMMQKWSFYDTETFTKEAMDRIIAQRDEYVPRKTPGECLGVFLNDCLKGFLENGPIWSLVLMFALWLACGRRKPGDWLSVGYMFMMFGLIYMVFIWSERYLANRIDGGLFLAIGVGLSFLMDRDKLRNENVLCAVLAFSCMYIGYREFRWRSVYDELNTIDYKLEERHAVDTILQDEEHLYFVKVWAIDHEVYGPLETAPAGHADKMVHIGGWSMHHPVVVDILDSWGVENPYKDLVNNESLRIIDHDIERTIAYIRNFYYPQAEAHLVEDLSEETGLKIYEITG